MSMSREELLAFQLGESIGYGRMMQLGEQLWRHKLENKNLEGGEFAVGCCVAFMVPCPHNSLNAINNNPEWFDSNGHCEWCCGAGRVTERVAAAMNSKD